MADISKCINSHCPIKEQCYRHTAKADSHWQAYFKGIFKYTVDGNVTCNHFYPIKKHSN